MPPVIARRNAPSFVESRETTVYARTLALSSKANASTSVSRSSAPVARLRSTSGDPNCRRLLGAPPPPRPPRPRPPPPAAFAAPPRADESPGVVLSGSGTYASHVPFARASRKDRTPAIVVTLPSGRLTIASDWRFVAAAPRPLPAFSTSACEACVLTTTNLLSAVICAGVAVGPVGSASPVPPAGPRRPPGTLFGRPR